MNIKSFMATAVAALTLAACAAEKEEELVAAEAADAPAAEVATDAPVEAAK